MSVIPPQNPQPEQRALEAEVNRQTEYYSNLERRKEQILEYLGIISTDSEGNDPAEFLSERDAEACADFIKQYSDKAHPFKRVLTLEVAETEEKLWGKDTQNLHPGVRFHQTRLQKAFGSSGTYRTIPRKVNWAGAGYLIGHIGGSILPPSVGNEEVYLCTDGKLRCTRNHGIFLDSYGWGVGTLPSRRLGLEMDAEETASYTNVAEHEGYNLTVHTSIPRLLAHLVRGME